MIAMSVRSNVGRSIKSKASIPALCVLAMLASAATPGAAQDQNSDAAACEGVIANPDAGIAACTKLVERESRRLAVTLTFRAHGWAAKGEWQKAFDDFSSAIDLDATFAPAYAARADLLRDNNQCDRALADYNEMIKLAPEQPATYVGRGLCLSTAREFDRAIADFDQVIKLETAKPTGLAILALSLRAGTNVSKQDYDEGIADYNRALALDAKRASLYIGRGSAWEQKGDPDRALADYDRAIEFDPANASGSAVEAWLLKADFYVRKDEIDRAIAAYDAAVRLDPKRTTLYVDRATLRMRKGDTDSAAADYDKAVELDPKNAAFHGLRGDVHRSAGQYDLAVKSYNQAIGLAADDLRAYGSRGTVRFYKGEFGPAAEDFKRVTDARADIYSTLFLYLSRARAGAKDAAGELAKAAEKLDTSAWPYPLAELLLGRKKLAAVQTAAQKPEEKCETEFYAGQWHLVRDAKPAAYTALREAANICSKDSVEYRGALEELKRLNDCSQAEAHWKSVERAKTAAAYREHLTRFAACAFATQAQVRLKALTR